MRGVEILLFFFIMYEKNIEAYYLNNKNNYTERGILWYPYMHTYIASFDGDLSINTALFSLMSINSSLKHNIDKFEHYHKCGEFKGLQPNKFKALIDCNGDKDCVIGILKGLKISNFYMNLLEPLNTEYVTIDRWAARIAGLEKSLTSKQYSLIKEAYIQVANKYKLIPNQLQAMTWVNIVN